MREIKFKVKFHRENKLWGPYRANELCRYVPSNIEDCGILMQYTGLKDKNGVEVYEADVLADEVSGDQLLYSVFFKNGRFIGVRLPGNYANGDLAPGSFKVYYVIGNIHEQPELIQEPEKA